MQGWFKWACHCLQVLLKWSFIVKRPFMALASQATLPLAWSSCVHFVPCTYCHSNESQFISVPFTTQAAKLTCVCKECFLAQHFSPFQACYFPASFSLWVIFSVAKFCSAELYGFCTSESCTVVFLKKLNSNFTVACHSFCVQAG